MRRYKTPREHDIHLEDGDLSLRPLQRTDLKLVRRWFGNRELVQSFFPDKASTRWFIRLLKKLLVPMIMQKLFLHLSHHGICFLIEWESRPIGMLAAWCISDEERIYRLPVLIGEQQYWGKGFGKRAIKAVSAYLFVEANASVLVAGDILASNHRSQRMFRACGFHDVSPEVATRYRELSNLRPHSDRELQKTPDLSEVEAISIALHAKEYAALMNGEECQVSE